MPFISAADDIVRKSLTVIENKFITKYLPVLEPVAVKVYMYALYLMQSGHGEYSLSDLAAKLEISEEDAEGYFEYLEEFELVKITSRSPFEVKILDCDNVYGKPKKLKPEKYAGFSDEVQAIIKGRMIQPDEFMEYYYLLDEYSFERNALLMIINYCVSLTGDDKINLKYIKKAAKSFFDDGITTAKKVEEKLSSYSSSFSALGKVFKECGITKKPDVEDNRIYEKWTKEMGFTDQSVIAASKYFKAKTTAKIDNALNELYKNKKFDPKEIEDYCKNRNSVFNTAYEVAKSLGIYIQNAAPYVESYVGVWINYGFEPDVLKSVANYCFLSGKNSFENMHDFILCLYEEGYVASQAVTERLEELTQEENVIKRILKTCGLTRKVIDYDKQCLKRWREWNFSLEMILKAAESSCGKSNPVAYMNYLLSYWKNAQIFSPDQIPKAAEGQAQGKKRRDIIDEWQSTINKLHANDDKGDN